ncbi:phosphatidylglycerophosphatase A [Candidatus Bipolaricaulota bacterium]|nr:phosphatidylglycerophosphatase A [Candidatus Bipolaricaulota bacterium]MBS3825451.1 phosphatidylglycerophosphatase A [Candidatus Bipolaricaulota bacterium]
MEIHQAENYIEVQGDFTTLSSAPLNGGLKEAKRIINHTTNPGRDGTVEAFFRDKLSLSGDPDALGDIVGFITAADVGSAFTGEENLCGGSVKVVLTAGVGSPVDPRYHNTINIIVITDLNLTVTGMANLFIVITEAKVSALRGLDVIKNGDNITGTPTDAIAVAKPRSSRGEKVDFSGTATELGRSTYVLVRQGVREALKDNNGYRPDRNILSRLEERGVSKKKIVQSAFDLLVGESNGRDLREDFVKILENYSEDPNIHFLASTAFYMEEENEERFELKGDPGRLIADELIGIDIAEYIGGKNALFNFTRYDRKKPGVLRELPPFLDDVVGGLIAGCMTKLFEVNSN